jgi:hypothetical protein
MSKAKGYKGETCAEAIRDAVSPGEVISYSTLFDRVRAMGAWKESAINQHLMSCVVNLPPARKHWKSRKPFLFLRPDGQYELFDRFKHPVTIE